MRKALKIEVRHYGPNNVEDWDCSTSVLVNYAGTEHVIPLETHEELDEFIAQLIKARDICPIYGEIKKPEEQAFPGVVNSWPIQGDE